MLDIYKTRYRLRDHPFRLGPDHRFSFDHPSYANARAYLKYAISQGEGFIAITGEPGTGKTTLIHALLAELDKTQIQVATLTCAQLDPRSLIEMVATSFGLPRKEGSKASLLAELEEFLIKQNRNGRHAVLIVDEAQGMSPESLEEFRLLSNLQHDNRLLMQVFLVGQDHLLDMIHAPGMEHLQQRLIAASHLEPLDLEETITYIEHRLCHVGWQGDPAISGDALQLIHKFSQGVPRRINLICHRLFLYGGLEQKHELTGEDALHVIEELHKERVLASETSSGDLSEEGIDPEIEGTGSSSPGLPRADSPVQTQQPVRQAAPPQQPETTGTENIQQPGKAPEPESDSAPEPIPELEPLAEEPGILPERGLSGRWMLVLALLAGLVFLATIKWGLSDRLTDVTSQAPAGTDNLDPLTPDGSDKTNPKPETGVVTPGGNGANLQSEEKVDWGGTIQREPAATTPPPAALDSPSANEGKPKSPVSRQPQFPGQARPRPYPPW